MDLVKLNQYSNNVNCVCRPFEVLHGYPPAKLPVTRPPLMRSSCFFEERGLLETGLNGRRIGLNMNYSIIFTEISFSPETSILLQELARRGPTWGPPDPPPQGERRVLLRFPVTA